MNVALSRVACVYMLMYLSVCARVRICMCLHICMYKRRTKAGTESVRAHGYGSSFGEIVLCRSGFL